MPYVKFVRPFKDYKFRLVRLSLTRISPGLELILCQWVFVVWVGRPWWRTACQS